MRVIEDIQIETPLDPWLSLEALTKYSGLSVRVLRASLTDPFHPLPHYRMRAPHVIATKAGKRRTVTGKILVRRSDFDSWMAHFKYTSDLDRVMNEVLAEFRR